MYPAEAGDFADRLADDDDGAAPGADHAVAAGSADAGGCRAHGVAPVTRQAGSAAGGELRAVAGEFPVGAKSLFHAADGAGLARVTVRRLAPGCTSIRDLLNVRTTGFGPS